LIAAVAFPLLCNTLGLAPAVRRERTADVYLFLREVAFGISTDIALVALLGSISSLGMGAYPL